MTLAAADGFRLSVRKAQLSQPAERSVRAIIPARALAELARIAGDETETMRMVLPANRGQVIFHAESVELVSQLIDGAFPDYKGIIPTGSANRAVVSTEAFLKACKAADIFAREAAHSARFGLAQAGSWSRAGGSLGHLGRDRLQRDRPGCHHRRGGHGGRISTCASSSTCST